MQGKHLLLIVIISSLSFLAIAGAGGYVYFVKPELLGIQSPYVKKDTLPPPPSPLELEAKALRQTNDSLAKKVAFVTDSIRKVEASKSELIQQRDEFKAKAEKERQHSATLLKKEQNDSTRLKNMTAFAEMYEKANPQEVAKILAKTDADYAAGVLKLMKRKNAAKVLEYIPTEQAVRIVSAR